MEPNLETGGKSNKKIVLIVLSICIIVGGFLWYFMYYTRTPSYSLNLIKESIEKHDTVKFKKHVDLDSTLSRGYDDLMAAMLESDKSLKQDGKAFFGGFVQMFKPTIVSALKDGITRFVETGKWEDKQTNENNAQQISPDKIANNSGLKNSSFKGVEYTKKDGKTAIVGLKVFEKEANKDFVIDVKMRELDDGTWQVAEISNLKEYFIEIEKAKNVMLKKYIDDTKSIVDNHNSKLNEISTKLKAALEAKNIEDAKRIVESEMIPDWNARADELNKVSVPEAAKEIHNLRINVCELAKKDVQNYIEWQFGKNPQMSPEAKKIRQQMNEANQQVLNIVKKATKE
ncbi:hypothetical protein SRRS_45510 [Sporomusa rhizae]|uniref:hypothetical protein n=1 Tax=Sporomusa rhizae TaxID=357999 RepID=UPI00352A2F17